MNADVMLDRWDQLRSEAQRRWSKLSDLDLDSTRGQADKLVNLVEERYGYGRRKAQKQVKKFMRRYGDKPQEISQGLMDGARDLLNDKPWIGLLFVILLLGIAANLLVRPNLRRYPGF